jgi:hypothetical protein
MATAWEIAASDIKLMTQKVNPLRLKTSLWLAGTHKTVMNSRIHGQCEVPVWFQAKLMKCR